MNKDIVFVVPSISYGGAERVVVDLANLFSKKNFNVQIISIYKKKSSQFIIDDKVEIFYLDSKRIILSFFKLFFKILRKKKSIFISSITPLNCIIAILIFFIKKHKLILMQHEIPSREFDKNKIPMLILPYLMKITYRFSDYIVCVSKGLKKEMLELLGPDLEYKIIHIYNLISSKKFCKDLTKNYKFRDLSIKENINILSIGRLDQSKDFLNLIEAFSLFNKEINSRLTIVGSGSNLYENALKNRIENLNLNNKVELIPFTENISNLYSEADIYVSSSRYESFGNTIVEAMFFNLFIVVTDCPYGPKEICQNGKYGYIAKAGSYFDLYRKMICCYKTNVLPDYNDNLKRFSQEIIYEKFSFLFKYL